MSGAEMREEHDASEPLTWFAARLRGCREQAGTPSLRSLETLTAELGHRYGRASIADKLNGRSRPDWEFVETFVGACARHAGASVADLTRLDLGGWRQAHRRMLRDLASLHSGRRRSGDAAAALRRTLPADIPAFTGRADAVDLITTSSGEGSPFSGTAVIHAIDGMPGIGKTALAVHVAHRLSDRFPDGQLFVDLHAHTPGQQPVDPTDALSTLLLEDGVDPQALPDDLEGRSQLWRTRTADRQTLLVLDNAAGSDQVAPLLPTGPGCLVLVTSRRHLADLPTQAITVPLDVLSPDRARQMFARLAPRSADDPDAVADLVRVCGYLPLAISLVARLIAKHPTWTLADLVSETRARVLRAAPENRSVAAAFDLSYEHLPPERQRVFRLLGLHPGAEIDVYAAAALTALPLPRAIEHLDALHSDHLLIERGYRRYGMHDLLRTYAQERVAATDPVADRSDALHGLMDYYQFTAAVADARISREVRPVPTGPTGPADSGQLDRSPSASSSPAPHRAVPEIDDHLRALSWLRRERPNLLACLAQADTPQRVVGLTAALAELLRIDGPWNQAVQLHTSSVTTAAEDGDRLGQAGALVDLGDVLRRTGDIPRAIETFHAALDLYHALGDRLGRANTLDNLGIAQLALGDFVPATETLTEARDLHRELGDRLGEATALNFLGDARRLVGDFTRAADTLRKSLVLYRSLDGRFGEATALNDLAIVQRMVGEHSAAEGSLRRAIDLSRALGDRRAEASALNNLGIVRYQTADHSGALRALRQALNLFRDLGSSLGQAHVLTDLGVVSRMTGDHPDAVQLFRDALELYRELGDRGGEAEALNELGTAHLSTGDLDSSRSCHRTALDLARLHGYDWDEAHALAGLGRCALAAGDPAEGRQRLTHALEIFQRLGAAEATGVLAELAALDHHSEPSHRDRP